MNGMRGISGTAVVAVAVMFAAHMIEVVSWAETARPASQDRKSGAENVEKLLQDSDCRSCHAVDRQVVGPSYREMAKRYAGQANAAEKLARSIRQGGSGSWGDVPMTPHPDLKDAEIEEMVKWILSFKGEVSAQSEANTKQYSYTLKSGETDKLDFPLFVEGRAPNVTKEVFRGYLLYNSYCYRCHGQDATESQLGPDLRRSLGNGMTAQQFLTVAMAGKDDKGMPSWAGFLSDEEIKQIYMYVQGRRLELIPVGRPPSDME